MSFSHQGFLWQRLQRFTIAQSFNNIFLCKKVVRSWSQHLCTSCRQLSHSGYFLLTLLSDVRSFRSSLTFRWIKTLLTWSPKANLWMTSCSRILKCWFFSQEGLLYFSSLLSWWLIKSFTSWCGPSRSRSLGALCWKLYCITFRVDDDFCILRCHIYLLMDCSLAELTHQLS